jgi:hypothetical protein
VRPPRPATRSLAFALTLGLAGAAPAAAQEGWLTNAALTRRAATDPAAAIAGARTGWVGWSVPAVPGANELCCFAGDWRRRGCTLGRREPGWGTQDDGAPPATPAELRIFLDIERGAPRAVVLAGGSCPVDAAGNAVVWLDGVDPGRSLDVLDRLARGEVASRRSDDVAERTVAAIAQHAGPDADRRLAALAGDRSLPGELCEQALFWAGEARGRPGYELLDRTLAAEGDRELREHAIFALTLSPVPEAAARIRRAAVEDREAEIRGQALFWLAQSDAPEAEVAAFVVARIAADPDPDVREQGVFALSQLDDGVTHLLRILRESDERELRRQALFWLGQSEDPRALAELERLLVAR